MTAKQNDPKRQDWLLKVFAVAFAIMLWFYADAEQNPLVTKHFDIPVQYVNQAAELVVENNVQTVRVTVRGKETDLSSLRSEDFEAVVDLQNAAEGTKEYPVLVTASNVVDRFSVQPTKVRLVINRSEMKEVPVTAAIVGKVPDGYELVNVEVKPDRVWISGMSSDMEPVTALETEPLDVSTLTADVTKTVSLQTPPGVTVNNSRRITVALTIQEKQNQVTGDIGIELRNVPDGMEAVISQKIATVHISGQAAAVNSQRELGKIQLYIDCSGMREGQYDMPVQMNNNSTCTVDQITPETVHVTLKDRENEANIPGTSNPESEGDNN